MAGGFSIRGATSVTTNSQPGGSKPWGGGFVGSAPGRPTSDTDLLAGINSIAINAPSLFAGWTSGDVNPVPQGIWLTRFGFGLNDNVISLDGGPFISFNSLPSGIIILTATLKIRVARYVNVNADAAGSLIFQRDILTESANLTQVNTLGDVQKLFNYDFSPSSHGTFLDVLSDGFGIKCTFANQGAFGQLFFDARIEGTYDFESFIWTVDTPSPVVQGQKIQISSPFNNPLALQLNELENVEIEFVDSEGNTQFLPVQILTQTENLLIFLLPVGFNPVGAISIIATGNGVQFGGSVTLGTLTLLYEDASGIYTIITDKRTDSVYNRSLNVITNQLSLLDMLGLENLSDEVYYLMTLVGFPNPIIWKEIFGILELSSFAVDESNDNNFFIIPSQNIAASTSEVKIPNPFVKLGFIGG